MWNVKRYIISSLLSLSLLCSPLCTSISLAAPAETVPKELLIQALTDWQTSIDELESLLTEQRNELTLASEESQNLKNLISKQREQLTALQIELNAAKSETQNAKESLAQANKELQNTVECVKEIERKKTRIERQRNLWQVIAAALGVVAAVK